MSKRMVRSARKTRSTKNRKAETKKPSVVVKRWLVGGGAGSGKIFDDHSLAKSWQHSFGDVVLVELKGKYPT